MLTTERRAEIVRIRITEQRNQKMRHGIYRLGSVCAVLTFMLLLCYYRLNALSTSLLVGTAGTILLKDGIGGYVLVGVIAFAFAVVLTTICFRLKRKQRMKERRKKKNEQKTKD